MPSLTASDLKRQRKKKEVLAFRQYQKPLIESWKVQKESRRDVTINPMATVFVARLSYDADDRDLGDVFRQYGPIKEIIIVRTQEGRPCGYAFVEFEQ